MDFRGREIDFREADRRYAELKRQLDAGSINTEEFDTQRRRLMVRDDEGRWWAKSRKTGEWNYHDGSAWVPGTPPGYQPPVEGALDPRSQLEQGERLPPSQTTPDNALVQDQSRGKQRRRIRRRVVLAVGGLVVIAALVGAGVIVTIGKGPEPVSGYDLVKDDSGALSVEVPSEWKELITSDSQGEKGKSWSSFLGESAGPSITAVNDFDLWRSGSRPHRGMYIAASKKLAQKYTDDKLIASGPNDYSSGCEAGTRQDFDRPPYSGKIQEWNNCGGESDHKATTLAAAPKGRECVVLLQIRGYLQGYEGDIQHVLDTFQVDCSKIT